MTFGLSGQRWWAFFYVVIFPFFPCTSLVFSYLAEAALAQHHEEVEVVDSHFDSGGADVVHRDAGQRGGRGHGRGEGLTQWHRQDGLHQGGRRRAVRLRLLVKTEGWRATHTYYKRSCF